MTTYRITLLGMAFDNSENPPSILHALFPGVAPMSVELSTSECLVTFATPQTPANLGPIVRVEVIPNP